MFRLVIITLMILSHKIPLILGELPCTSEFVKKSVTKYADILLNGFENSSIQEHHRCIRGDDAVFYLVPTTEHSEEMHSRKSQGYASVFHFSQAQSLEHAVDILIDVSYGHPNNWVYVILIQEKLSPQTIETLTELIENEEKILTEHLNILSLKFILEAWDRPICQGCQTATVLDIYAFRGKLHLESYQVEIPLRRSKLTQVYAKRHFHNVQLRIAAMPPNEKQPYRVTFIDENNRPRIRGGFEAQIIYFLAGALNFTILAVKGSGYLASPFHGAPGGMAEQVLRDEIDVALETSEILSEREKYVTFLMPTYESPVYAIFIKETNNALRNVFLKAFDSKTWSLMIITWSLLGSSLLLMKWLQKLFGCTGLDFADDGEFSDGAFLWAVGVACQQGWHICPNSVSMRIVMMTGQILGLLCYVAFGASLVSILSTDEQLIQSQDDLIHYGYKFYSDVGTYSTTHAVNKLENRPFNNALDRNRAISAETALKFLHEKSHVAFLGLNDIVYPVFRVLLRQAHNAGRNEIDKDICSTYKHIRIEWTPVIGGMFVKKHSPLQNFFNQKIILMIERGLRRRNFEYYYRRSAVRCPEEKNDFSPLDIGDVWTSFCLLLVGYIPSLILLAMELIHYKISGVISID